MQRPILMELKTAAKDCHVLCAALTECNSLLHPGTLCIPCHHGIELSRQPHACRFQRFPTLTAPTQCRGLLHPGTLRILRHLGISLSQAGLCPGVGCHALATSCSGSPGYAVGRLHRPQAGALLPVQLCSAGRTVLLGCSCNAGCAVGRQSPGWSTFAGRDAG